ncbi:hypothetical protein [Vibrio breoganii]|uniref:hypothetical protein n=1 Tax=Vibrio breoganii TaxID=553239 RepID=UPI0013000BAC|nr:hypothetical protein [Vibrio breoganii]
MNHTKYDKEVQKVILPIKASLPESKFNFQDSILAIVFIVMFMYVIRGIAHAI